MVNGSTGHVVGEAGQVGWRWLGGQRPRYGRPRAVDMQVCPDDGTSGYGLSSGYRLDRGHVVGEAGQAGWRWLGGQRPRYGRPHAVDMQVRTDDGPSGYGIPCGYRLDGATLLELRVSRQTDIGGEQQATLRANTTIGCYDMVGRVVHGSICPRCWRSWQVGGQILMVSGKQRCGRTQR